MRVYKPSGIEWLGEIPKHWEIRRLKYLVERIIGGGTPDTSNLQYWANDENEGYLWVSIEDITNADFITDTKRYINQSGLANSSAKLLPPFSILYSIYASLGKIAYSNKILATNQAILGIQPNELLFYKFLFYYLQNTTNHIISFSNTTTQNNISLFIVANHKIPLPPLQEQKEIAEFLDSKCEKIQNYIDKKQKLITLLQEKKQALINEVVTKGLNPNIEFKNSGIAYLGLIPHHWEVTNLKNIVSIKSGGTPSRDNKDYWNGDIPWIRSEFCHNQHIFQCDVKEKITTLGLQKSSAKMCEKNTILIALVGATIGQVAFLNFKSAINQNIAAIYPNNAAILDNVFLFFVALTFKQRFEILGKYAIANLAFIGNLKIPLPPLQEQKQIANFLDEKCEKINSAIEKTKRQITLIKEYKNTLINEAVCGRIKLKEVK
ncbi:restriction endonuclease subunit S [Campylobacter upsaliensis]|nr:restriction endonuclease subunit S [Campylobacter upsaliensis]